MFRFLLSFTSRPGVLQGIAVCLAVGLLHDPVSAFMLTAPEDGVTVPSGESVRVSVQIGKDINLKNVSFYWYRREEEPLATRRASPASFTEADGGSPVSGTVRVPEEGIGIMRLLAVGEVMRGRLESYEEFDEVVVMVEPKAALTSIEFAAQHPWRLDTIGRLVEIPVLGQFQDGVARPLAGQRSGSRFRSSDEQVVSVDQAGMLQVVGNGRALVTVENRGKVGNIEVLVDADASPNQAPIAQVEEELRVKSGSLVVLDGLRSRDPDGDPLRYEWKQLRGHRVPLTNVDQVKATFMAPKVSEEKLLQFSLTVTDMVGPDTVKGAQSRPAVISVWVRP